MKLHIAVVAGALMGVSALAGKPESPQAAIQFASDANAAEVTAIGPVVEALRSGDATYTAISRAARTDYVPMRPPL